MDIMLHANILSCVLSNLKERNFIGQLQKIFCNLEDPSKDELSTLNLLNQIIKYQIVEKKEVVEQITTCDYSSKLEGSILYDVSFSKSYMDSLLNKLNIEKTITKIEPLGMTLEDLLGIMKRDGLNERGAEAKRKLHEIIEQLSAVSRDLDVKSIDSKELVLDPDLGDDNKVEEVSKDLQKDERNRVKTFPAFDMLIGGGLTPSAMYVIGAISGGFKSGLMQNLIMYAAKNNSPDDFVTDGLKPVVVYFSFEMSMVQCLDRLLSWMGKPRPTFDKSTPSTEIAKELNKILQSGFIEFGFKLPILFKCSPEEGVPDAGYVDEYLVSLETRGYKCVLACVDYLDRCSLRNKRLEVLGESGGDGSAKLRHKAREFRDVGVKHNIPMVSATQLNSTAMMAWDRLAPHLKMFDPLQDYGLDCIGGSKYIRSEVEEIILCQMIEIKEKIQDSEFEQTRKFLAISTEKDRDSKKTYKFSTRDKENRFLYNNYVESIKNSSLRGFLKIGSKGHVVCPMDRFKVNEDDWGQSIRMFYPGEASDFVSLNDIIRDTCSVPDGELNPDETYVDELGFSIE